MSNTRYSTAILRQRIDLDVFDYQVLRDALAGYGKPRDKITRLLASGEIVRVKKGLYCFGEAFRKSPICSEYLANLIYGPSYVSLDYALRLHGLIPERVEAVTSVTTRCSRGFETPLGHFTYRTLSHRRYDADGPVTLEVLQRYLANAIDSLDVEQARREIAPFARDPRALEIWSHDFFRDVIGRIVAV